MLIAWSVTEVIRYSYFVITLSGYKPAIVTWFRYNTFFVLYPLGISSECWLIYKAIEPAGEIYGSLYPLVLKAILLIYIPGMFCGDNLEDMGMLTSCRFIYFIHTHD